MTSLLAAILSTLAASPPAPEAVLTCSRRIEGTAGPITGPGRADVVVGPVGFTGLVRARRADWAAFARSPATGGWRIWKAPPYVRAGRGVTLVVPVAQRGRVRIGFAGRPSRAYAVRLEPCAPSHPAWSDRGGVGRYTAWAGGFELRRPTCLRLQVWVDGREAPLTRSISLLAGRCP